MTRIRYETVKLKDNLPKNARASVEKLKTLKIKTIYPGHGKPFQMEQFIASSLISPYIKNEKPLSLLIVAKPESGKSSAMKQYRENKGIVYLTDCTARALIALVLLKFVVKV